MYPSLTEKKVSKHIALEEFLTRLGDEFLYAFKRGVLGVLVNGERTSLLSKKLKPGDYVIIFPVAAGG